MVERFNGRISDILKTHRFRSGEDLETTLHRYVFLYNHHLPQTTLKSRSLFQAMKDWYASNPECFVRNPDGIINNHPGHDS